MFTSSVRAAVVVAACSALLLSGCSSSDTSDSAKKTTASAAVTTSASSSSSKTASADTAGTAHLSGANFHFHDAFVKAAPQGEKMTAVFGVLENHTDRLAHLVGFSSSVKAQQYQIHEVVDGNMRQKTGGLVIPANDTYELQPGGDHFMIMGLEQPVEAGSKVTITLKFDDGSSFEVKDVPVRAVGAGNESYGDMNSSHTTAPTATDKK